jgi:hypothetical protein
MRFGCLRCVSKGRQDKIWLFRPKFVFIWLGVKFWLDIPPIWPNLTKTMVTNIYSD